MMRWQLGQISMESARCNTMASCGGMLRLQPLQVAPTTGATAMPARRRRMFSYLASSPGSTRFDTSARRACRARMRSACSAPRFSSACSSSWDSISRSDSSSSAASSAFCSSAACADSSRSCSEMPSLVFLAMSISRDRAAYSRGVRISPSLPSHFFPLSRSRERSCSWPRRSRSLSARRALRPSQATRASATRASTSTRRRGTPSASAWASFNSSAACCSSSSAFSFSRSDTVSILSCQAFVPTGWAHQDSNLDRIGYEPRALAVELWALLVLHEALEALGARGVAQLAQRLGLDLADALAGHLEVLPHLLQGVIGLLADAEAHAQHLLLARGERGQHLPRLLGQVHVDDGVGGADDGLVLDEVAQVAVLLLADGGLQGDGLLGDLEDLAHLVERQLHLLGDLLRRRLAPQLLHQVAAGADELVDGLDHVHRDADGAGLVGDGAGDGLPDPPGGVGGELVAALVLELVHRLHEADVPLLDQVQELQAAVGVLLGDGDHQSQVRLHQLGLGPLRLVLALHDGAVGAPEVVDGDLGLLLHPQHLSHRGAHNPVQLLQVVALEAE